MICIWDFLIKNKNIAYSIAVPQEKPAVHHSHRLHPLVTINVY